MKFKLVFFLIALLSSVTCFAQEVKVQDLLDAESKLAMKKINDDLGKQQLDAKVNSLPKLEKTIAEPLKPAEPFTVAIFGISPNYSGYMNFNGTVVLLKKGDEVFGRTVLDITKNGITLQTRAQQKAPRAKKVVKAPKGKGLSLGSSGTKFYPIVLR